jgi:hypothetical protein
LLVPLVSMFVWMTFWGADVEWVTLGAGCKKNGGARGAAKFREETSKKADSAVKDRIAAMHNVGERSFVCKRYFAAQHHEELRGVDSRATGE